MKRMIAFCLGAIEFNGSVGRSYDDSRHEAYDWGREIAHRVTFRRFEQ